MSCNILSGKDPAETVVITFDFSPALNLTETITEVVSVDVEVSRGIDANPQSIIAGQAIISLDSLSVQLPVTQGIDSVNYSIKVVVDTTNPDIRLALTAILPVRAQ